MSHQSTKRATVRRPLTVRLDRELERRLAAAAARENRSLSDYVRQAITERLERGAAHTSLWDRIAPSVIEYDELSRGSLAESPGQRPELDTHAEFATGVEAEAGTTWRRLDE